MLALNHHTPSLKRPFNLFRPQSRINRRLIELMMRKLADESVAYHEGCTIRYDSETNFRKSPFWPWSKGNISYHSTSAHIIMHSNAVIVLGYRLFEGMEAFSPPFYISLNENPELEAKLNHVKKVDFISLQSIGKIMEIEFKDYDHPNPILLTIKELDLFSRSSE